MKKKSAIVLIFIISISLLLITIGVPILINELYKINSGYITEWRASDVLSYYGSILGAIGTIALGIVAIYQTKKANDISEKLLQIEETHLSPQIDLRAITSDKLKKYDRTKLICCHIPNNMIYITDDMREISNQGDNFWFELKNIGERDILSVTPQELVVEIIDINKKILETKKFSLSTQFSMNSLTGKSTIPFILGLNSIWDDVCKNQNCSLLLKISFLLMNSEGVYYNQKIELEMINSNVGDTLTPVFVNKKVHQSEIIKIKQD